MDAIKDVKLVGLYFSMHHCPPCREFTPIFGELYKEVNSDNKVLEVIFCSFDVNQEAFKNYYGEMPWLAMPFNDSRLQNLYTKYAVNAVPRLLIFKSDGKLLDNNAVGNILKYGPEAIEDYLSQ